jgi:hypothetical protein
VSSPEKKTKEDKKKKEKLRVKGLNFSQRDRDLKEWH